MSKQHSKLISEASTVKGIVCIHEIESKPSFFAITLNNDKSPERGVLGTENTIQEATAFSRGIWMALNVLKDL